jgi:hypothetical protein
MNVTEAMMEAAARNLCALRKVNLDQTANVQSTEGGEVLQIFLWQVAKAEILANLQVQQATHTGFNNLNPDGSQKGPQILVPTTMRRQ